MKRIIKNILTFLFHPLVVPILYFKGTRNLYIGPQITINKIKFLNIGRNVSIGRNSRFLFITEYGGKKYVPKVDIGKDVSIGNRFSILSAASVQIDNHCLIASDVLITSENHGINPEEGYSYAFTPLSAKEVVIGKGCWIGEKASILPGVILGERCIVAANSVVTKSFPAYTLIAGVPAKAIKTYNFDTHRWEKVEKQIDTKTANAAEKGEL